LKGDQWSDVAIYTFRDQSGAERIRVAGNGATWVSPCDRFVKKLALM
jgi:hypothetical protein